GLRHSHKTWMAEDGVPEILAERCLGHEVPGMRGLYTHVSDRMRDDLKAALQARWEQSLRPRRNLPALAATPPRRHDGPAPRGSQPGTDAAGGVYSYPQPAPHSLPNKDDLPNSSQQGEGSRYRRL